MPDDARVDACGEAAQGRADSAEGGVANGPTPQDAAAKGQQKDWFENSLKIDIGDWWVAL